MSRAASRAKSRAKSREVLVARQDSLGDVLLCGPAIRAVAAGGARVTLLCGPRGRAAAELLPGVAKVLEWRADWIDAEPCPLEPQRIERFVALLRRRRFDEALIFTSFHQSPLPLALLLRMAGVERIGAIGDDYPGSLLDVRHRVSDDIHEVDRALSLASACGYEPSSDDDGCLRLSGAAPAHPQAAALGAYVVVHPGASVPARSWSPGRYRELVRRLLAAGHNVVVTGAASERVLTAYICQRLTDDERERAERAASVSDEQGPMALDLAGRTDLPTLAGTIEGARATIVANTGPAHLAAAVGTPTVCIYAPTVPSVRWRPWGVPHRLLELELPCAGCRARDCPIPHHPCMEGIEVADVQAALDELMAQTQPKWAAMMPREPVARTQPDPGLRVVAA